MAIAGAVPHSMPYTSTILLIAGAMAVLFLGFLLREMCERFDLEFRGMYRRPAIVHVQIECIRKSSFFLNLPPELRNSIYEHTLVSHEPIRIGKTVKQPPLLQVCKQIRREAGPLYFHQNNFRVVLTDLDFTSTMRLCQLAKLFLLVLPTISYSVTRSDQGNWENLLTGAKAVHVGLIPRSGRVVNGTGHGAAAMGALRMAHKLRRTKWKEVKKSLEEYKEVVVRSGTGWTWV
ncbi:hypothetical protein LTR10_007412 [Elasticomyces elasticus]|nr:hypothetical protein LTR10_007412 [Elasticomyces elasticus]KAK4979222.1 hypothetical protein LTR42_001725 [Elasticomyces elasticus]